MTFTIVTSMIDMNIAATKTTLTAILGLRGDRLTPAPSKLTSAHFPLGLSSARGGTDPEQGQCSVTAPTGTPSTRENRRSEHLPFSGNRWAASRP
ncbi:hypothetical protein [Frankia sp. AiPa1]|uniref:hypothetical protein n=1 Tax=Frankia sp. AiPa1 TaxID=573492 RepID=UPI00202B0D45|nr:hypothetical protein [Frankia sp. AiPa1]